MSWRLLGPPERIVISYETTRLTSPLKAGGQTIDYAAALRSQYESPQAGPFQETPLAELLRRRAVERPSPEEEGPTYFDPDGFLSREHIITEEDSDRRNARIYGNLPIVAASDPDLAEIMESNMPWYKAVIEQPAYETTLYLVDLCLEEAAETDLSMNSRQACRELARRIQQLARYEFGRGRPEQGIDAIEWGLLLNRASTIHAVPLLDQLSFISADATLQEALVSLFLHEQAIDERQLARICEWKMRLDLHINLAESIDTFERYRLLNAIQTAQVDFGESDLMPYPLFDENLDDILRQRWVRNSIRWNEVLKVQNQHIDNIRDAMKIGDFRMRGQQVEMLCQTVRDEYQIEGYGLVTSDLNHLVRTDWTNWLQAACFNSIGYIETLCSVPARDLNRQRILNIVARIATWRQRFGVYPENLNQLLTLENFPEPPEHVSIDAFTLEPFRYLKTDDGFVISSAGQDMIHEVQLGAQGIKEIPMLDDRVWSWPP